jgi:MFS family permease
LSTAGEGIFDRRRRPLTLGVLLAISAAAFEGLALTTVAHSIARDLDGVGLYGWVFSAFLLPQLVATVAAGERSRAPGLRPTAT